VIILNKDAVTDLKVELDFGRGMGGVVETETLSCAQVTRPGTTPRGIPNGESGSDKEGRT
jgi:hypothetical protein